MKYLDYCWVDRFDKVVMSSPLGSLSFKLTFKWVIPKIDLLFLVIRDPWDKDLETILNFEDNCIYDIVGIEERVGIIDGNWTTVMNCKAYIFFHL